MRVSEPESERLPWRVTELDVELTEQLGREAQSEMVGQIYPVLLEPRVQGELGEDELGEGEVVEGDLGEGVN